MTIVYEGEVEHRDSSGGGGKIGPGDVQWMTAGSGVVHEEFHGREFAKRGGMLEMVQLWVNLPSKNKMTKPRYQGILNSQIPVVNLPNDQGTARVIAGEFNGVKGPAKNLHSDFMSGIFISRVSNIWSFAVPNGYTTALVVLKGAVKNSLALTQ